MSALRGFALATAAAAALAGIAASPNLGADPWPWEPTRGHRPVWKKSAKRSAAPDKKAARKRQRKARAITRRAKS